LHRGGADTDEHEFLVITAGRGIYRWQASAPKPPQHSAEVTFTLDPDVTSSGGRGRRERVDA
jgi:hypothetical protein